jgi:thiamine-phosphate diphosphorylase
MAIVSSAAAGLRAASRATIVQLRAPALSTAALENELNTLVATASVPIVVSSRCDIAIACDAAGVNLPEGDIPIADARMIVGRRLIGRSVHSRAGAVAAEHDGADYVVFGPVWESASHPGIAPAGLAALVEVVLAVGIPVLAIGGVTAERTSEVLVSGAAGYAAIRLFE